MSTLAKPVLRGHSGRYAVKLMVVAAIAAATNSSLFYFLVSKPKQEAYHEFLRTYDAKAHVKELHKYGMFTYRGRFEKE